ncbi:MAG: 2-amino-4-hydroxy-6-hydroxymethyldihydropteridine diphosphokinase [Candidatus Saganbacteria bacterium]|nr:2-amino-4-hydroxy-6-hydroxymethyldihydropteridine diphosphokinase [Candidatus Saganbacteria bacterium]
MKKKKKIKKARAKVKAKAKKVQSPKKNKKAGKTVKKPAAKKQALSKMTAGSNAKAKSKAVKQAHIKAEAKEKFKLKPGEAVTAYLALGSNVGDREEYIEQAITILKETPGIKVVRRASNYETEPEGKRSQPAFINSAVEIKTTLDPDKLLATLQGIEDTLGRERGIEWGPRIIDIDILLYKDLVMSEDDLSIPHPLLQERMFVLEPLKEIASRVVHPVLETTIFELFEEKKAELAEKYNDELPGFREIKKGAADDFERW